MLHEVHLALSFDLAREVCWRLWVTRPQRHARDSVVLFLAGAASTKHDRWFEAVEDINVDIVVRYLFGNWALLFCQVGDTSGWLLSILGDLNVISGLYGNHFISLHMPCSRLSRLWLLHRLHLLGLFLATSHLPDLWRCDHVHSRLQIDIGQFWAVQVLVFIELWCNFRRGLLLNTHLNE